LVGSLLYNIQLSFKFIISLFLDFETTFRSSHTEFAELNVDHNILNENVVNDSIQPNVTNLILHRTNIFTELVNIYLKKQDIASGHILLLNLLGQMEFQNVQLILVEFFGMSYQHFGMSFMKNVQLEHFIKSPPFDMTSKKKNGIQLLEYSV